MMMTPATSPESTALAQQVSSQMFVDDRFSQLLGMTIVHSDLGAATVKMPVTDVMMNGVGSCHGGATFALADSAFAFACNSRNQKSVALNCMMSYTQAAMAGDVLIATATETSLTKKTGTYDITITNQHGDIVALFRGIAYNTGKTVLPE